MPGFVAVMWGVGGYCSALKSSEGMMMSLTVWCGVCGVAPGHSSLKKSRTRKICEDQELLRRVLLQSK